MLHEAKTKRDTEIIRYAYAKWKLSHTENIEQAYQNPSLSKKEAFFTLRRIQANLKGKDMKIVHRGNQKFSCGFVYFDPLIKEDVFIYFLPTRFLEKPVSFIE